MTPLLAPRQARALSPIARSVLFSVAIAAAAITTERSLGAFGGWQPPLWAETSAASRESLIVLGPLLAALGAWVGGWRHTMAVGVVPARGWSAVAGSQLLALVTAVIGGHLVGLAPLLVVTAASATGGSPSPAVIASGLVGLVVMLLLGFGLGAGWSSRLAVPVAAIASYPLLVGPVLLTDLFPADSASGAGGTSFYSVALVWLDFGPGIGNRETLAGSVARLVFLASLGGAALLAAVRVGEPDRSHRRLAALVPFVVPVVCGVVLVAKQPVLVEESGEQDCAPVLDATTICVPSEVSLLLPELVAGAEPVFETFGFGAATSAVAPDGVLSDSIRFWYFGDAPEAIRDEAAFSTSRTIAGDVACSQIAYYGPAGVATDETGAVSSSWQFADLLGYSIARRAGLDADSVYSTFDLGTDRRAMLDRIEELSNDELRAYLDEHHDELASCTAGVESLGP